MSDIDKPEQYGWAPHAEKPKGKPPAPRDDKRPAWDSMAAVGPWIIVLPIAAAYPVAWLVSVLPQ